MICGAIISIHLQICKKSQKEMYRRTEGVTWEWLRTKEKSNYIDHAADNLILTRH